jgi:hypothetical protein
MMSSLCISKIALELKDACSDCDMLLIVTERNNSFQNIDRMLTEQDEYSKNKLHTSSVLHHRK